MYKHLQCSYKNLKLLYNHLQCFDKHLKYLKEHFQYLYKHLECFYKHLQLLYKCLLKDTNTYISVYPQFWYKFSHKYGLIDINIDNADSLQIRQGKYWFDATSQTQQNTELQKILLTNIFTAVSLYYNINKRIKST